MMSSKRDKYVLLTVLVIVGTLSIFLAVYFGSREHDGPEELPIPVDPWDGDAYPPPNKIDLRLESNFTNLVDGTTYTLQGTYRPVCAPSFVNGSMQNTRYGYYLELPCSSEGSFIDTGVQLGSRFTVSSWVMPMNDTLNLVLFATNLQVRADWDTITALGMSITDPSIEPWIFYAITVNGNFAELYVNDQYANTTLTQTVSGSLKVLGPLYNGNMNGVRSWDYVLNSTEIGFVFDLS